MQDNVGASGVQGRDRSELEARSDSEGAGETTPLIINDNSSSKPKSGCGCWTRLWARLTRSIDSNAAVLPAPASVNADAANPGCIDIVKRKTDACVEGAERIGTAIRKWVKKRIVTPPAKPQVREKIPLTSLYDIIDYLDRLLLFTDPASTLSHEVYNYWCALYRGSRKYAKDIADHCEDLLPMLVDNEKDFFDFFDKEPQKAALFLSAHHFPEDFIPTWLNYVNTRTILLGLINNLFTRHSKWKGISKGDINQLKDVLDIAKRTLNFRESSKKQSYYQRPTVREKQIDYKTGDNNNTWHFDMPRAVVNVITGEIEIYRESVTVQMTEARGRFQKHVRRTWNAVLSPAVPASLALIAYFIGYISADSLRPSGALSLAFTLACVVITANALAVDRLTINTLLKRHYSRHNNGWTRIANRKDAAEPVLAVATALRPESPVLQSFTAMDAHLQPETDDENDEEEDASEMDVDENLSQQLFQRHAAVVEGRSAHHQKLFAAARALATGLQTMVVNVLAADEGEMQPAPVVQVPNSIQGLDLAERNIYYNGEYISEDSEACQEALQLLHHKNKQILLALNSPAHNIQSAQADRVIQQKFEELKALHKEKIKDIDKIIATQKEFIAWLTDPNAMAVLVPAQGR